MAPVYREIELEWEGRTYRVTPTYAMIQRIEQRISLASLLNRCLRGEPPLSQLADLIAISLSAAGCKAESATAENIHAEMYDADAADAVMQAGMAILTAILPQRSAAGKSKAPETAAGAQPTSSGPSTSPSPSASLRSNPQNSGG